MNLNFPSVAKKNKKKKLAALGGSIFSGKYGVTFYVTCLWYKMFSYTLKMNVALRRTLITSAAGARWKIEMEGCYRK